MFSCAPEHKHNNIRFAVREVLWNCREEKYYIDYENRVNLVLDKK